VAKDREVSLPLEASSPSPRKPEAIIGLSSEDRGRFSSQRKVEAVLRLLRGEDLDALSRELGVTASKLAEWRETFLAGGQVALKSRQVDVRDDEVRSLREKVGDLTMRLELHQKFLDMRGIESPLVSRRSKR
jgi:transposase